MRGYVLVLVLFICDSVRFRFVRFGSRVCGLVCGLFRYLILGWFGFRTVLSFEYKLCGYCT